MLFAWKNDHPRCLIRVEIDGAAQLQRNGIVHFNVVAGTVDVEILAGAGHAESIAGAAVELLRANHSAGGNIDDPELGSLVAAGAVGGDGVAGFMIGRDVQALHGGGCGTDGGELKRSLGEVETRDAKNVLMHYRVGRIEKADQDAGLLNGIELLAEVLVLHAGKLGLGKLDGIDDFEI